MSENVDADKSRNSSADTIKWTLSIALLAIAVTVNQLYSEVPLFYRAVGIAVLCILAAALAAYTLKGKAFLTMLKDARIETRKVVWPTKQETTQTTLLVLGVVVVMSLILWVLDLALGYLISLFIG